MRTSAMGDVALTTPVIVSLRKQYPEIEIIMVTRPVFAPFFYSIDGLQLFLADFKKRHRGLFGLLLLFRDINRQNNIDYVIDLHDVIRSKILRWLFRLSGKPVSVIDKGRAEKKDLISGTKKVQLKHSVERYFDVFARAGLSIQPERGPFIIPSSEALEKASDLTGTFNVGVAPYAKHKLKTWPEENMVRLLAMISDKRSAKFWLFGGREEAGRLEAFQQKVQGSTIVAGNLTLNEELAFMHRLDFMIALDSSNMHMASLVGTRVISIWGGTDPLTGFGAWQQPDEFAVRIPVEKLTCRPCTVYGKGKCKRGDFACMEWLTPEMVFEHMINLKIV